MTEATQAAARNGMLDIMFTSISRMSEAVHGSLWIEYEGSRNSLFRRGICLGGARRAGGAQSRTKAFHPFGLERA